MPWRATFERHPVTSATLSMLLMPLAGDAMPISVTPILDAESRLMVAADIRPM